MDGEELMDLASAFEEVDGGDDNGNQGEQTGKQGQVVENPDDVVIEVDGDGKNNEDEEVVLVNEDGERVNEDGELIDEDGNVIDAPPPVDASGKVSIPDDAKVVLKIDGKDVEKTYGEIVANAQKYEGAEKRFQEADAIRKDAEAKLAVLPQREQQLNQVLEYYIAQSQQYLMKEPDWNKLLEENPTEYVRTRHAWDLRIAEQRQAEAIKAELAKKQSEAEAASRQQRLVSEQNSLLDAIPEWKDPQKAKDGSAKVMKYILDTGIPQEMLADIDHHQVIVIARKAMLYDEAIAKQKAARANGGRAPNQQVQQQTQQRRVVRVERPGAGTAVATVEARNNAQKANRTKAFKSAPSVDTLAGLFMD